jgi:phosphoglycolate phosphatase
MIKLVVFDWNGVLIADATACMEGENYILRKYGRKTINLRTWRETSSIPARDFFFKMGFTEAQMQRESMRMQELFHEYYEPRIKNIRSRRNARKLLDWISSKRIEAVILSNHTVDGVQNQVQRLNLQKYFTQILASDAYSAVHRRDKRKRFGLFMKERKLEKKDVLIIGDSPEEVEIGNYYGITNVAITGGSYSTRRLKASNPDYIISNLRQLIGIIEKLR